MHLWCTCIMCASRLDRLRKFMYKTVALYIVAHACTLFICSVKLTLHYFDSLFSCCSLAIQLVIVVQQNKSTINRNAWVWSLSAACDIGSRLVVSQSWQPLCATVSSYDVIERSCSVNARTMRRQCSTSSKDARRRVRNRQQTQTLTCLSSAVYWS